MLVVHANWVEGRLALWGERTPGQVTDAPAPDGAHPFGASVPELGAFECLRGLIAETIDVVLPALHGSPAPSPSLAHATGHGWDEAAEGHELGLGTFRVPSLMVEARDAEHVLDRVLDRVLKSNGTGELSAGPSVAFFAEAARLARQVLAHQRFVPMLLQEVGGQLRGQWSPWLSDGSTGEIAGDLLRAMPPIARAARDSCGHDAWRVLDTFITAIVDATCRATLEHETMIDTIDGRDSLEDDHVAWLAGLLGSGDSVRVVETRRPEIIRSVRRWIGGLDDRGMSTAWRLLLRLGEPIDGLLESGLTQASDDDAVWSLSLHLQAVENPEVVVNAADVWLLPSDSVMIEGLSLDQPRELLLAEVGRASRLFKPLEEALSDSEPVEIGLTTRRAYEFLREARPLLIEQGFGAEAPAWWDSPAVRLGARLRIESEDLDLDAESVGASAVQARIGLDALVHYHWDIAIGGATLTLKEFEQLAARRMPLVRIGGKWVEIRPEDVAAAVKFIGQNPGGEMSVAEAIRIAYGTDRHETGVPIVGMEASGWVSAVFSDAASNQRLPTIEQPSSFHGELRPYQARGLSWMAFMERFGFGVCLADDMGLGKTIQLLALLAWEREQAKGEGVAPTLLVVPMSVVGNWMRETERFCPNLRVLVHHGLDRLTGDAFVEASRSSDVVVTTYALANRDREQLGAVGWRRVVLDEAQYVKNPQAKQSRAVREFKAARRVALTGTPVENRLAELWSIMDFLNPGYLGLAGQFRKRFSVPIERYHDQQKLSKLRGLVQPFVLRRLKSDPLVAADLPEKVETREFCNLTPEQAELYQSCVQRMLTNVDQADGIHRRGLVLAALIRLKQICNHPSQVLKDHDFDAPTPPDARRSGKCARLLEMLDEVIASGQQALVFTQFRQMGHLLSHMLRQGLDREVLFLHGGVPQAQRQHLIEQFQGGTGQFPVLLLSLRAGGVGLNLTAATHVFHFDRWWNPAVENQATDRAYRIGQTRTVQVHKFVVSGTLEQRIDEMIEQKTHLAEQIIGSGERWLTELGTDQLRDLLALRPDAVVDDVREER